jgi:hypothetical protein
MWKTGKYWRWIGRLGTIWLRKPKLTKGCKANGRRRGRRRRTTITWVCVRKGRLTILACLLVISSVRCKCDGFAMYEEQRVYKTGAFFYSSWVLLFNINRTFGPGSKDNRKYLERMALGIEEKLPWWKQVFCQGFSLRHKSYREISYTTYRGVRSVYPYVHVFLWFRVPPFGHLHYINPLKTDCLSHSRIKIQCLISRGQSPSPL